MGILDVTVYSASVNKNPGDRDFDDYSNLLDWCHFGRSAVDDFESKSSGTIFSDYQDIGTPSVARVVGGAADSPVFKWTGGTPTATESSGTQGMVRNTTNTAGFRLDTSALDPAKVYRFVFFIAVNNGGGDLDISLSAGSASAFSGSVSSGSVESFEVQVVCRVDSASEFLRFDWTKTSGTQTRLLGAVVEDFGYELSLRDTFTDTNGTGIESHTPDYARAAGQSYEAVGSTTTSNDPTGSGGITIQSNQLQFAVSSERARFYTGSKDQVVEIFWVTSATSGHRIGISPRHVDKANQYWFNLREPNDDYSFYTEDEDDAPSNQTNLLAGAQPFVFDTSKTYFVRTSVIGLVMRLEVDGELINTFTDGADAIPGADGISFGTAGIGTNNHFDSLKVWSPPLPIQFGSVSESGAANNVFSPVANVTVALSASGSASSSTGNVSTAVSSVVESLSSSETLAALASASAALVDAVNSGEQWALQISSSEALAALASANSQVLAQSSSVKNWIAQASAIEGLSPAAASLASFVSSALSDEEMLAVAICISDLAESLVADESFNPKLDIQQNISNSVSASESFFGAVVEIRNIIANVAAQENFDAMASGVVTFVESGTSSVTYSSLIQATENFVQSAISSGEFSNFSSSVRNWSETLSATYDMIASAAVQISVFETSSSAEAFTSSVSAIGDLTGNVNLLESFVSSLNVIGIFSQFGVAQELFSSQALSKASLNEISTVLDNLSAVARVSALVEDNLSVADSFNIAASFFKTVSFDLSASESVQVSAYGRANILEQALASAQFSASETEPGFLVVGAINIVAALLGAPSTGDRYDDSDIF